MGQIFSLADFFYLDIQKLLGQVLVIQLHFAPGVPVSPAKRLVILQNTSTFAAGARRERMLHGVKGIR